MMIRGIDQNYVSKLKEAILKNPMVGQNQKAWPAVINCTQAEFEKSGKQIAKFEIVVIGGLHRRQALLQAKNVFYSFMGVFPFVNELGSFRLLSSMGNSPENIN